MFPSSLTAGFWPLSLKRMTIEGSNASEVLLAEFHKRKAKNASYSLRAFARQLGVPAGRLSQYFSGKRAISSQVAAKIADKMGLNPKDESAFLKMVRDESAQKQDLSPFFVPDQNFSRISTDSFTALSDWQYFAILNLLKVKNFQKDPAWIAERLGITKRLVVQSIARLKRLGLIEEQDGILARVHKQIRTTDGLASRALKISHEQSLRQAIDALHEVDLSLRDITSITMAVDLRRVPAAKRLIKEFRRKLSAYLEAGEPTEVYNLNVQLVPVTKVSQGSKYDH